MKQNINRTDRLLRFTIGLLIALIALWQKSWIAAVMAIFIFYEAWAGWCVFYQVIGKSSCKIDKK